MPTLRKYIPVSVGLTEEQVKRLNKAAKDYRTNLSDMGRNAIEYWLQHYEAETLTSAESSLQKEIRSIRALIVKAIMLSAQATWFSALPITKAGFPEKKPPQKYMDALWNSSMIFAGNQLRAPLGTKADFSEEQKPISKNK
ncbi:MAG: hypothetical protein K2X29_14340 [Candidatus Obscuribacterales bacterium]|nr:hypothetical protein [Candidatus Obscuribacterales bacterium]